MYPMYIAPISQPTELICFAQLPNGRIQDLSYLCGGKLNQPPLPESPIAESPDYIPPNAANFPADSETSAKPVPEEEE